MTYGFSHGGAAPYALAARFSAYWPGCKPWIAFHPYGSDAYYQAIADEMAPLLLANTQVIAECGLEHWNTPGFMTGLLNIPFGKLMNYLPAGANINGLWLRSTAASQYLDRDPAYCLQSAHAHAVMQARFDTYNKGIKVIGLFGSQYTNDAVTATMINFSKTLGSPRVGGLQQRIPIGAIAQAPYIGTWAGNNTTWVNAATGNWGAPEIHCILRHANKYDMNIWSCYSSQYNRIKQYVGPAMAGQVNGLPALYSYEKGIGTVVPGGSVALHHDLWYHPEMAYSFKHQLLMDQIGDPTVPGSGTQLCALFAYQGMWGNGGGASIPIWQHQIYGQQASGNGAYNLYTTNQVAKDYPQRVGNGLCNDRFNQTVILPQLQDWFSKINYRSKN